MDAEPLTFPFAVLDFEASSLGDERSYPIEAGLAVADSATSEIRVWSSLIKPTAEWVAGGDWSAKSANIHGIERSELDTGHSPADVAAALNELVANVPQVRCDGGDYDHHWLRRLFDAARMTPTFKLCDLSDLLDGDRDAANRYAAVLSGIIPSHRAGDDAERICAVLIKSAFA